MRARAATTDFDERGQLRPLVQAIGPEEPELGAATADPGEALRLSLLSAQRTVLGHPTPFVGRREALERVYNGVRDAVRASRLGVIAVTGAPGLGKTRLLAEALSIIDPNARGIGVWPILASENDGEETIIAKFVRRRFGISTFERDQDAWDRVMAGIEPHADSRVFGTLSRSLGFLAGLRASGPDALSLTPNLKTFHRQARRALSDFMRAELTRAPQIIVIGRAHLLSAAAAEALRVLITDLADTPLIAVFIAENSNGQHHPWPVGPDIEPAIEVAVAPLESPEVVRFVRALGARDGDGDDATCLLDDGLIDDIVAHAAGSPGLAEINLRLLVQRGVLKARPDGLARVGDDRRPLARDLDEADQVRIHELSPAHRLVLGAAAIIGTRFEHEAAETVADAIAMTRDLADRPKPELLLKDCEDFGIIEPEPAQSGERLKSSRFSHENERLRLIDSLDEADRELAHAVAAQWLLAAKTHDMKADGPLWERVAQHWISAARPAEAALALREAALCARRGLSIGRARALFRKALLVLGLGGPGSESAMLAHAQTVFPIIESYAQLSNQTSDFQTAPPLFHAILALARITRDRATQAQALFGLGFAYRGLGRYADSRRALEAARAIFRDINHADGLAGCLVQLARLDWFEGGPEQRLDAVRRCDEALAIRRRLGAPRPLAETLVSLANIHIQRGDHDAARGLLEEGSRHYRELHDLAGESRTRLALGALAFYAADYLQAIAIWRDALQLAERAGERELIAALLDNLGEALIETGDFDRAGVVLQESRELAEDGGDPRILADALKNLAVLHARSGRPDEAAEALSQATQVSGRLGIPTLTAQLKRAEGLTLMLQPPTAFSRSQRERAETLFAESLEAFRSLGDAVEQARTKSIIAEFAGH